VGATKIGFFIHIDMTNSFGVAKNGNLCVSLDVIDKAGRSTRNDEVNIFLEGEKFRDSLTRFNQGDQFFWHSFVTGFKHGFCDNFVEDAI